MRPPVPADEKRGGIPGHSARSASMGSRSAARHAGYTPDRMQVPMPMEARQSLLRQLGLEEADR